MKLTIIGFWGGYPKKNEASSGYLLEHNNFRLLIDCGSGVLSKLPNYLEPEELNAVILSHYHPDHMADIGVLQHARLIQGLLGKSMDKLPIYGHTLDQIEYGKLTYKHITEGRGYSLAPEKIGPFTITFLQTKHPVPCYAMRIEADGKVLVYTGDSAFMDVFSSFSLNADILLCECNFYAGQNGQGAGHMTSTEAGKLAHRANVKRLILTHLPHFGDHNQLINEAQLHYNGPVSLASEGLIYEI